jgi:hypothetical protein
VTLKVKYSDHKRTSRRATLDRPTSDGRVLGRTAVELLDGVPDIETRGVRLTGVSCSDFTGEEATQQLSFDEPRVQRGDKLGAALDAISGKFGKKAVRRAVLLDEDE